MSSAFFSPLFFYFDYCWQTRGVPANRLTDELASQKWTGGPLICINVIYCTYFVHTKFIWENPLSGSALLTGTTWSSPFKSLSSARAGMFRGSLKFSRYDVIMSAVLILNLSQSTSRHLSRLWSMGPFLPLAIFLGKVIQFDSKVSLLMNQSSFFEGYQSNPVEIAFDWMNCIHFETEMILTLRLWIQSRCQSPRSSVGGIVGLWENAEENQPLIGCLIISLTHSLLLEMRAIV